MTTIALMLFVLAVYLPVTAILCAIGLLIMGARP